LRFATSHPHEDLLQPDFVLAQLHSIIADTLVRGGGAPRVLGLGAAAAETLDARGLERLLAADDATLFDLATSLQYRDEHIPGAWFAVRARLTDARRKVGAVRRLVFTSPDGVTWTEGATLVDTGGAWVPTPHVTWTDATHWSLWFGMADSATDTFIHRVVRWDWTE